MTDRPSPPTPVLVCRDEPGPEQLSRGEAAAQARYAGLWIGLLRRQQPQSQPQSHGLLLQERRSLSGPRQRWIPGGDGEGKVNITGMHFELSLVIGLRVWAWILNRGSLLICYSTPSQVTIDG